jgi:hypothetical protein
VNRTVTSEARAQTGQAWLPEQRRVPAPAGPGINAHPDVSPGREDSTGPDARARQAVTARERAETPHPGRHRRAPEARTSYREVFAVGEFRALFGAQVLSFAGDQFAQVAIAILVYGRTHSAFLTALAYALTYLPPIAGGPLLSGLADLFPRRRIMIVCDLFRVVTAGLMAIPGIPFAALCTLLFCTVLAGVPFSSARAALMPDVLPGDKFVVGSAVGNIAFQASQILGFVAGAAVVAILDPHKTLAIDAGTFGLSALIIGFGVRLRPAPARDGAGRSSLWSASTDGIRLVFGSRLLLTLLLFGWLAGFYIVPEGLAAPYARSLHGSALTVGLLMAAVPLGTVIGAFLLGRAAAPSARIRMMGWNPPLWVVLTLWILAGAGGAYQLAAAAAFVQALRPETRARAFGVAQSGLYAVQGLGIVAGGAVAQVTGAPLAVGLAGLVGVTAATMLAMNWTHLRTRLIQAQQAEATATGA